MTDPVDEMWEELEEAKSVIERLRAAIRSTVADGAYDEIAIRKAVSFDLAEMIVEARAALEQSDRRAALDALTEHDQRLGLYEQNDIKPVTESESPPHLLDLRGLFKGLDRNES